VRSSLDLSLPSRAPLHRRRRLRGCPHRRLPPLRFLPLRRLPGTGQLLILGGTSLQVRALSAFLTLAGPSSARVLPALFHAGPALGVHPFRVDLHSQSRAPSRTPLPSWGWRVFLAPSRPPWPRQGPGKPLCCLGRLSRRRRFRRPVPLQGIAPCERLCLQVDCLSQPGDHDPRGFLLPRGFPLLVGDPPRVHPLTGFAPRRAR